MHLLRLDHLKRDLHCQRDRPRPLLRKTHLNRHLVLQSRLRPTIYSVPLQALRNAAIQPFARPLATLLAVALRHPLHPRPAPCAPVYLHLHHRNHRMVLSIRRRHHRQTAIFRVRRHPRQRLQLLLPRSPMLINARRQQRKSFKPNNTTVLVSFRYATIFKRLSSLLRALALRALLNPISRPCLVPFCK